MRAIYRDYDEGIDFYLCQNCRGRVYNIKSNNFCQHCGVQFTYIVGVDTVDTARENRLRRQVPRSKTPKNVWVIQCYELVNYMGDCLCLDEGPPQKCASFKDVVEFIERDLRFSHGRHPCRKINLFEYEVIDETDECTHVYYEVERQAR